MADKLDRHGLTNRERGAVDRVCVTLGYGGLDNLCELHEYSSAKEIAEEENFKSVRDYFLGGGWHARLIDFKK